MSTASTRVFSPRRRRRPPTIRHQCTSPHTCRTPRHPVLRARTSRRGTSRDPGRRLVLCASTVWGTGYSYVSRSAAAAVPRASCPQDRRPPRTRRPGRSAPRRGASRSAPAGPHPLEERSWSTVRTPSSTPIGPIRMSSGWAMTTG
ncbi:hypothetical protein FM106_04995 [Brachybacterium faecium]|nr:hypothetical protein FM106_04995 [Brachybacterium faecium]